MRWREGTGRALNSYQKCISASAAMPASFECDVADNEITMGFAARDTFRVSHLYKLISAARRRIAYGRIINDSWKNALGEVEKTISLSVVCTTSLVEVNRFKSRGLRVKLRISLPLSLSISCFTILLSCNV